ncbi:hypothetical protein C3731_09680 [Brucella oryzae]|uniref:Glycosyltransferase 2-like domain-containing protein n=1 Tax=Brucella oryzae TaxID=335286 RepID=A0A2S7IZV1_9HYPH|nr:hypothetical protein C3731_09680 [Brucella oryzae]
MMNRKLYLQNVQDVRAVILIPAYGQPALTAETLQTAIAQKCEFPFAIVVVNDGCPSPETHEICQNFASCYPGSVFYLHKANNGLSAARNTGLEFALGAFPALEAVFFLDCDNHIDPSLLQRLVITLRASDEKTGWIYTDVDKFGFSSFSDMSGSYSALEHLFRSFCEAGSMVSRRMLDAGARFDEAMRKGVEDWDFWLQGLALGFHGVHVPNAGFHYRRRGESMLTEAERDFTQILDYIRKKHSPLYNVQAVLKREIEDCTRYAVYHPDTGQVHTLSAVAKPSRPAPLQAYLSQLLRAAEKPDYGKCPGHLFVIHQTAYDHLKDQKLLSGVLWNLECALQQAGSSSCGIELSMSPNFAMTSAITNIRKTEAILVHPPTQPAQIWAVEVGALLAQQFPEGGFAFGNHWHMNKQFAARDFSLQIGMEAPQSDVPLVQPATLALLLEALQDVARTQKRDFWHSIPYDRYRAQAAMPRDFYPELFRIPSVFPINEADRTIAFVIDHPEAEDIARASELAKSSTQHGLIPHLICFGSIFTAKSADLSEFAEIVTLPMPSLDNETSQRNMQNYMGTALPNLDGRDRQIALATLAAYSTVVSVRSSVLHLIAGALRKLRVKTFAIIDNNEDGASNSVIGCSAFEQAYDAIFPASPVIRQLCNGIGYPTGKLKRWEDYFPSKTTPIIDHPERTGKVRA